VVLRRTSLLLILVSAGTVSLALECDSASAARPVHGPPGNAGVQESVETLPDGVGLYNTNDIANALEGAMRSGTPGRERAPASLARVTTPPVEGGTREAASIRADGRSPPAAALERIAGGSGPGGMGLALPILLLLALAAVIVG
jgi:hypothetical protein